MVVGVGRYRFTGELKCYPDLPKTVEEVNDLEKLLHASGTPFSKEDVHVLHDNQIPTLRPTKPNILSTLQNVRQQLTELDTLLIVLNGHGVECVELDADGRASDPLFSFCPLGAKQEQPETRLEIAEMLETITREIPRPGVGEHKQRVLAPGTVLFIVNACRNEERLHPGSSEAMRHGGRPARSAATPLPDGVAILWACKSDQSSWTDRNNDFRSFFFTALLDAWRGAGDDDRDGDLTLSELERYVTRTLRRHGDHQRPRLENRADLDVVLRNKCPKYVIRELPPDFDTKTDWQNFIFEQIEFSRYVDRKSFVGCQFLRCKFSKMKLGSGVSLTGARFYDCQFSEFDIRDAVGVRTVTVYRRSPSSGLSGILYSRQGTPPYVDSLTSFPNE